MRVRSTARRRPDRRPGPQHVLRLPGAVQPDDRGHRARRHRSGLPLRPGRSTGSCSRLTDARRRCRRRRLHRQEHHRSRRQQHRPTRRARGRSTTSRPRTTAPTARPTTAATLDRRRTAGDEPAGRASRTTRTSGWTRTASTSRPTSTTCSRPVQRRADLRVPRAAIRPPPASITFQHFENTERRRLARLHGLAGHLARRRVLDRAQRHRVLPEHHRRRRHRDRQPDRHRQAHRHLGDHEHRSLNTATPRSASRAGWSTARRTCSRRRPTRSRARHPAARVRQRHDAADTVRPGLLAALLPRRARARRGGSRSRTRSTPGCSRPGT